MENPIKMDDLGVPLFSEAPNSSCQALRFFVLDPCWRVESCQSVLATHFGSTRDTSQSQVLVEKFQQINKYSRIKNDPQPRKLTCLQTFPDYRFQHYSLVDSRKNQREAWYKIGLGFLVSGSLQLRYLRLTSGKPKQCIPPFLESHFVDILPGASLWGCWVKIFQNWRQWWCLPELQFNMFNLRRTLDFT